MSTAVRILGLDPGLQVTGYGVLELTDRGPRVVEAGVVRSEHSGRDTADMARRVKVLYDGVCEVLDQWHPRAVAVEQLYAHYDHPRTAVLMAHARGCFFLAAAQRGVPAFSYPPGKVKKSLVGHGRAGKEQMQAAIARELGLARPPEPHDVADALAVALCHYYASATVIAGSRGTTTITGVNRAMFEPDTEEDDENS
jgi:crossover junction endodeoxyribonuclease RuvC